MADDARVNRIIAELSASGSPTVRVNRIVEELSAAMGPSVVRVARIFQEVSAETTPGLDSVEADASERAEARDSAQVRTHGHVSLIAREYAGADDRVFVGPLGHISLRSAEYAAANDSARIVEFDHTALVASESARATDSAEVLSAQRYGPDTVVAGEIRIPGRPTEYISTRTLRHPTRIYRRSVISWGSLDRSIPIPAGFPRVSDLTFRLADTDGYYRRLFAQVGARAAEIVVRMGPVNGRVSHWPVVFRGRVDKVECPPGEVRPTATDSILRPFHERPPALITPSDFPALPEAMSDVFAPIPYGRVSTEETSGVGAIQCPLVNESEGWYLASRERIHSVRRVLTWSPGQEEFEVVPRRPESFGLRRVYAGQATGWFLEEHEVDIRGETYRLQVIRFTAPLPEGTQVRADVWGIVDDDGEPIENVVDILEHYLGRWMGLDLSHEFFDVEAFAEARAIAETAGLTSPNIGNAIVQSATHAENLARLLGSVDLDFFPDRFGRLSCKLTLADPPDMPVLDDLKAILWDSFSEVQGEAESANRLRYRTGYTPSTGEWYDDDVYDQELDQELLGEVRERELDLWYVRGIETGGAVASRIAGYLDSQARRLKWDLSAPRVVDAFDLADIVGVRHFEGLESETGTYDDPQPVKVAAIRLDLDNFVEAVEAVTREPGVVPGGGPLEHTWITRHTNAGPWRYGRASNFYGVFRYTPPAALGDPGRNKRLRVAWSRDWGRTWRYTDGEILANEIASHTSVRDGRFLHIATQEEPTGRVAYWRYDMLSREFAVANMEAEASTGIDPAYRGGEPMGAGSQTDAHVDVEVRANGDVAVLFSHAIRGFDDGLSAVSSSGAPGWYWWRRPYVKILSSAGVWSEAFRGSADVSGLHSAHQSDRGGMLSVDPGDGISLYVWYHPRYTGIPGRSSLAMTRVTPSNSVVSPVKFHNAGLTAQFHLLAGPFSMADKFWDAEEEDWIFRVPVALLGTGTGGVMRWSRGEIASYATENTAILRMPYEDTGELVGHSTSAAERCAVRSFLRNVTTWSPFLGIAPGGTAHCRLRGPGGQFDVSSRGRWNDFQSLVFDRGGELYCASFPIHLKAAGHFELWPESSWPVDMTHAEWLEIYGG